MNNSETTNAGEPVIRAVYCGSAATIAVNNTDISAKAFCLATHCPVMQTIRAIVFLQLHHCMYLK